MASDSLNRATLHDVARVAGVSIASVSYVLNGRKDRPRGPSPEVQERVREAVEKLGYRVNTSARTLRRIRTELVAIVYRPPVGPWLEQLVRQTEDFAAKHGYSLICVPIFRDDHVDRSLQVITRGYVDGVILTNESVPSSSIQEIARGAGAVVVFDDLIESSDSYEVVRVGQRDTIAEATRYLMSRGRTRIAYAGQTGPDQLRYLGYVDALTGAGTSVDPDLLLELTEDPPSSVGIREFLGSASKPDAVICETDRGALSVLHAARESGIRVPEELAIIGVGNTSHAELSDPPLTSVGTPMLDFDPVISALFERIEGRQPGPRVLSFAWELNLRSTT